MSKSVVCKKRHLTSPQQAGWHWVVTKTEGMVAWACMHVRLEKRLKFSSNQSGSVPRPSSHLTGALLLEACHMRADRCINAWKCMAPKCL